MKKFCFILLFLLSFILSFNFIPIKSLEKYNIHYFENITEQQSIDFINAHHINPDNLLISESEIPALSQSLI